MVERRQAERRIRDRRDKPLTQVEMLEAVAEATGHKVGRIHRRRLVAQSFLAAMAASLFISIPVAWILEHDRVITSRENASYNCHTFARMSSIMDDFVRSDAKLRYEQQHYEQRAQVIRAFRKILPSETLQSIQERSDRLDTRTQAYWTENLRPKLQALADVNCNAAIK